MVQFEQTLFKTDSLGKERFISYTAEDGLIHKVSGVVDGKHITHTPTVCKGKNIGKSNETTPTVQAVLEIKSKIKDKLVKEYFATLEEAKNTVVVLPMLAKTYTNAILNKSNATELHVQRKYDGIRCIAHVTKGVVKLMSRSNKDIMVTKGGSMQHIANQMSTFPDGIYDGELFNLNIGSFQMQTKAINKYVAGISEQIDYNVYDMILDMPFKARNLEVGTRIAIANCPSIKRVPTEAVPIDSVTNVYLKALHDEYVTEGYEGAIVRVGDCPYEMNKRSKGLLKMKQFFDIDAEIIAIIPQDSDPTKGQPVCRSLEEMHGVVLGAEFKAGMSVSHAEQKNMLANPNQYTDKIANIRFFEATDDGLPRHPVYHGTKI